MGREGKNGFKSRVIKIVKKNVLSRSGGMQLAAADGLSVGLKHYPRGAALRQRKCNHFFCRPPGGEFVSDQ